MGVGFCHLMVCCWLYFRCCQKTTTVSSRGNVRKNVNVPLKLLHSGKDPSLYALWTLCMIDKITWCVSVLTSLMTFTLLNVTGEWRWTENVSDKQCLKVVLVWTSLSDWLHAVVRCVDNVMHQLILFSVWSHFSLFGKKSNGIFFPSPDTV